MNIVRIYVTLLLLSIVTTASHSANTFFVGCEQALKLKEFRELSKLTQSKSSLPIFDMCFRLNDFEFLITITDTGRAGQGLYYYNSKTGFFDFQDGAQRENINVEAEFTASNNKRYVLLRSSYLHNGSYSTGYEILNLIPKEDNKPPFHIYKIIEATEDPITGLCGESLNKGTATSVVKYDISANTNGPTRLVFDIEEENCVTKKIKKRKAKFVISDGVFKEESRPTRRSSGPAKASLLSPAELQR